MPLPEQFFKDKKVAWTWIAKSSNRPVFLGTWSDGKTKFVIKWESRPTPPGEGLKTYPEESNAVGQAEFRRSFLVMAHLHEVVASYKNPYGAPPMQFPEHCLLTEKGGERFKKSLSSDEEACACLNGYLTNDHWCPFFIAMELVANLNDLDSEGAVNVDTWKSIRRALLGKRLFYSLGKIAAVDFFLGNTDRFNPNSRSVINNIGNIFSSGVGSADGYAVGLDFFDPVSQWMNMYSQRTVKEHEKEIGSPDYPGNFFKESGSDKKLFADKVVAEICDVVGAQADGNKALYASAFLQGLTDGAEGIQNSVTNNSIEWHGDKYYVGEGNRKAAYPAYQLWYRADFLDWLPPGDFEKKMPPLKKVKA